MKGLGENHGIPEPWCLEVAVLKEVWKDMQILTEQTEHEENFDADADALKEFNDKWKANHDEMPTANIPPVQKPAEPQAGAGVGVGAGTDEKQKNKELNERDKVAVAEVRKTHALADRAMRDFRSVLTQSAENQNTKDCKFEQELEVALARAGELDREILEYELKHLSNTSLLDTDLTTMAKSSKDLVETIQSGRKLVQKLKSWFKG